MAYRQGDPLVYRHYRSGPPGPAEASSSTPPARGQASQASMSPQMQVHGPAYTHVPFNFVGPQGQPVALPPPNGTIEWMAQVLVPHLEVMQTKRTSELEASLATVRTEASEHAKKMSEHIHKLSAQVEKVSEKVDKQQLTAAYALSSWVKKIDKVIGKSQDLDQSKSMMGRLDELTYAVGELLERAKDPGADLPEDCSIRLTESIRDASKFLERGVSPVKFPSRAANSTAPTPESSPVRQFASAQVGTTPVPDLPAPGLLSSQPESTSSSSMDLTLTTKTYANAAISQTPHQPSPSRKATSADASVSPMPKFPSRRDIATSPVKVRKHDMAVDVRTPESSPSSRLFAVAQVGTSPMSKQSSAGSPTENIAVNANATPEPSQNLSSDSGAVSPQEGFSPGILRSRPSSDATLVEDLGCPEAQPNKIVRTCSPFEYDDVLEYIDEPTDGSGSLPGPIDLSTNSILPPSCTVKDSSNSFSSVDWANEESSHDKLPGPSNKPMAIFHPDTSPSANKAFTLLNRQSFSPDGTVASLRRDALGNPFAGAMASMPPRPVSPYYSRPSVTMPSPPSTRSPSPVLPQNSIAKSPSPNTDAAAKSQTLSTNTTSESLPVGIAKSPTPHPVPASPTATVEEPSTSQILPEVLRKSASPPKSQVIAPTDEETVVDEEAHVSQLIIQDFSSAASSPIRGSGAIAESDLHDMSGVGRPSQLPTPMNPPSRPTPVPSLSMTPAIKHSSSPPSTSLSRSPIQRTPGPSRALTVEALAHSRSLSLQFPPPSPVASASLPSPKMFQEGTSSQRSSQLKLSSSPLRQSAALFTPIPGTPLSISVKREIIEKASPMYISSTSVTPQHIDLTMSPSPALSALTDFSDDDAEVIPVRKLGASATGKQKEKPKEKGGLLKLDLRDVQKNLAITRVKKRKPKVMDEDAEEPPLKRARQRKSESLSLKKERRVKDPTVKKEKEDFASKNGTNGSKTTKVSVKKEGTQSPSKKRKAKKSGVTVKWPGRKRGGDAKFRRKYVKCDICAFWYHYGCVGIVPDDERILPTGLFTCPPCEVGSTSHPPPPQSDQGNAMCARPDCSHKAGEEEYFVSAIVGRKGEEQRGGVYRYKWLVKWDGFPITQATWEGEDSMSDDAQKLIEDFEIAAVKEGIDLDEDPHTTVLLQEALNGGWRG